MSHSIIQGAVQGGVMMITIFFRIFFLSIKGKHNNLSQILCAHY